MSDTMNFPIFKGLGNDDLNRFWFIAKAIWTTQNIIDDHMNKTQLVTALQDCGKTWHIKYCTDNLMDSLADTQTTLNKEFNTPKCESQSVIRFKEIMMRHGETPWELDQRLKFQIREGNMNLTDGKHREWFVASLLPHLKVTLSQKMIGTQVEALEIMMRLHETPIQDASLGVQQIHTELQNLFLEFQSLKKNRVVRPKVHEEVWCLKYKIQGHDKEHFPIFANYVAGGGLIHMRLEVEAGPSTGPALWCAIRQVVGKYVTSNFHLLQKFVQTPQQLFHNFCKLVGHEESNFYSYELMMERTPVYRIQTETRPPYQGATRMRRGYQGRG